MFVCVPRGEVFALGHIVFAFTCANVQAWFLPHTHPHTKNTRGVKTANISLRTNEFFFQIKGALFKRYCGGISFVSSYLLFFKGILLTRLRSFHTGRIKSIN